MHSILYDVLERDPPKLTGTSFPICPRSSCPSSSGRCARTGPALPERGRLRDALRDARRALAAGRAAAAALMPGRKARPPSRGSTVSLPPIRAFPRPRRPSLSGRSGSTALRRAATWSRRPPSPHAGHADRGRHRPRPASGRRERLLPNVPKSRSWQLPSHLRAGRYLVAVALFSVLLSAAGVWCLAAPRSRPRGSGGTWHGRPWPSTARPARRSSRARPIEGDAEAEAVLASDSGTSTRSRGAQGRDRVGARARRRSTAPGRHGRPRAGDPTGAVRALCPRSWSRPADTRWSRAVQALNQHFRSRTEADKAAAARPVGRQAAQAGSQGAFVRPERLPSGAARYRPASTGRGVPGQATPPLRTRRRGQLRRCRPRAAAEEKSTPGEGRGSGAGSRPRRRRFLAPSAVRPPVATGGRRSHPRDPSATASPPPPRPTDLRPTAPPARQRSVACQPWLGRAHRSRREEPTRSASTLADVRPGAQRRGHRRSSGASMPNLTPSEAEDLQARPSRR